MATVSRSVFLAGGSNYSGVAAFGQIFFSTAANQYAIITLYPGGNGTLFESNIVSGYNIDLPLPGGSAFPYEVHVPPNCNVYSESGGDVYIISWIIFQST